MLFGSECVEKCPENTLNLMNLQCISKKSCEQENSEYWKDYKFVPSNGRCRLMKYYDSIEIDVDEEVIETRISFDQKTYLGCQVVQGFVDIQFPSKSSREDASINVTVLSLREIEEIHDYLKGTNSPTVKNLVFLPKLKMIRGVNLESGENSLVFDSNTTLESLRKTSQNYTFIGETFCASDCNNSNFTIKITPKTYGFLVKVRDEEFKNDNIRFTYSVMISTEYHTNEICKSLPSHTQ